MRSRRFLATEMTQWKSTFCKHLPQQEEILVVAAVALCEDDQIFEYVSDVDDGAAEREKPA